MKVNLMVQTSNKFNAICKECGSENVKFGMVSGSTSDGWGGRIEYTKLSFECEDCTNSWSMKY